MIYSCFDPDTGLYRYFEDARTHPINGDLPVPKFGRDTGRVGVPSMNAARPLPSSAKPIGKGWHARGVVVQCKSSGLGVLEGSDKGWVVVAGLGVVGAVAGFMTAAKGDEPLHRALYGAAFGSLIGYLVT